MKLQGKQDSLLGAHDVPPQNRAIPTVQSLVVFGGMMLFSVLVAPSVLGDCKCNRPEKGETTHWGGNQVVVSVEEKSYRRLQGTIEQYDGRPLEHVLVELFDHPEYLLDQSSSSQRNHPEQKRLATCRTTADGRFCFRNLPSGKYELRSSLSSGWDVTHIYVVLDKKAGQNVKLHVKMEVGT
jgi:hypothetical protein